MRQRKRVEMCHLWIIARRADVGSACVDRSQSPLTYVLFCGLKCLLWLVWSDELLVEFFEFYAFFNFAEHGVSVITGSMVEKPDVSAPVYIENPLERELNVSKNVLESHLQIFQTQCRQALDSLGKCSSAVRSHRSRSLWGLLSILKTDDQLQLTEETEEPVKTRTMADEGIVDVPVMSTEDVVDTDHVDPPLQELPLGVVNIHEILREDNDAVDNDADNISNRTV